MELDIACISSKGQFVIPRKFRDQLGLKAGSKMVLMCDGAHLLLKPIRRPHERAFRELVDKASAMAEAAEGIASKAGRRRRQ